MNKMIAHNIGIYALILNLVLAALPQTAFAGLIGTGTVIAQQEQQDAVKVRAFLDRDDVRAQLVSLGVAPEAAQARIDMLTESELQQLGHEIDSLPAGGNVLGVIGAVFVVLIILELVGVTDIFNKL